MITVEPDFTSISPDFENHQNAWYNAMDWARLEIEIDALKAAFIEWANDSNFCTIDQLTNIPAWKFQTIGRVALLMNKGAIPPETTLAFFMQKLEDIKASFPDPESDKELVGIFELNAKQKRTIGYVNLYSFIDAIRVKYADDDETIEKLITERLRAMNPNRQLLKMLYIHFKESMSDAITGRDNEEVASTINGLIVAVNVIAGFSGNAKIADIDKKVGNKAQKTAAGIKVRTIDADTNIASVSPATIPGSSVAVVYNTKDRKVMIYTAKADCKLNIKGTKVIDYDEVTSFAKTLRKPKAVLPGLRDASNSKRAAIVLNQYVKGKSHIVNGRISKDMIIVKVFK
jgi:hypothetical protein